MPDNSMGLKQAIILAGGLGTRLRSAVPDLPKCLAPVAGKPFLSYVIDFCLQSGIRDFIFALGYKSEPIQAFLKDTFPADSYQLSIESEPLGTGGAIRLACSKATEQQVLILNGDTLFNIDVDALARFHHDHKALCTLGLRPMENFDRYGVVELDETSSITSFLEKQYYAHGLINGGVYALDVTRFMKEPLPEKFSFEKDWLERSCGTGQLFGFVQNAYFIDIGIPEDLERAQKELHPGHSISPAGQDLAHQDHPRQTLPHQALSGRPLPQWFQTLAHSSKDWTLFLDRDGVINKEKEQSYVFHYGEFAFYEDNLKALRLLAGIFPRIVVVTNQRGVGKGLMTAEDLADIHARMTAEIAAGGGRIDAIYYCDSLSDDHPHRKPNPGMAFAAQQDIPGIDLSRSIMVGNNISDMEFGRNAGMHTVFLSTTSPAPSLPHPAIDLTFPSLHAFTQALLKKI
jgi:D-glycero-alpha-D-manno-heptose 1-phosphate guanylyltransferase